MNETRRSETLLRAKQIRKSFGAVQALKGVSFELFAGEVHALVGENGAGKSTLVKIITGAVQPDDGTIEVYGERLRHLSPGRAHKLGVACIYQQPALLPDLSVAENLWLRLDTPGPLKRVRWSECRARAGELLERMGTRIPPEAEIRELSMPEQQLVEIACAIGSGARIIIMDEPTASLTQNEQTLLFSVVRNLTQSGAGVVYISHRLEEVFALADRVTILRDGQSVQTTPIGKINEAALIRLMVGRDLAPPVLSSRAAGTVVLSLRHLGCSVAGIRDINLDIRAGEIVGLAGLVGAGRTELARVLFGITPADEGEMSWFGERVGINTPREAITHGIGYLPEDRRRHGVILDMSIAQNISLAVLDRLFAGGWLRPRREEQLALEFMRKLAVKAPSSEIAANTLSGGNQQKIALARWMATQARLLILDEPTQGVDIATKADIHRMIKELAESGVAVLLISSDLPEVMALSDRLGVMRGGALVALLPAKTAPHDVMSVVLGQECPAT